MTTQDRLTKKFLQLVEIDGPSGHERDVADFLSGELNRLGLEVREDQAGEAFGGTAGNLIARKKGTISDAPSILFCAHMDTIQPTRGIRTVITNGTIATDQSTILGADDRAGLAIILETLELLEHRNIPHGPIEVVFTVGEEIGMWGSKHLQVSELVSRTGFVFDSSAPPGAIIVEAPGSIAFEIRVVGKAAHAAVSPEKGINAIQVASRAVADLPLGRFGDTGTINVGIIQGGKAINIVPDEVILKGEVRSPIESELQEKIAYIEDQFVRQAKNAGAHVEFKSNRKYNGFRLGDHEAVVQLAMNAVTTAGLQPSTIRYAGGSDANILNEKGIQTVNLGVGFSNVHSSLESIAIEHLVTLSNIGVQLTQMALNHRKD